VLSVIGHGIAFRFFGPFFGFAQKDSTQAALLLTPLGEFVVIIATAAAPALIASESGLLAPIAFLLILLSLISFQPLYSKMQWHESLFSRIPTFGKITLPKTQFLESAPHIISHVKAVAINLFTVLCLATITVLLYRALPTLDIVPLPYARQATAALLFLFFSSVPLWWAYKHAKYFLSEFAKLRRKRAST